MSEELKVILSNLFNFVQYGLVNGVENAQWAKNGKILQEIINMMGAQFRQCFMKFLFLLHTHRVRTNDGKRHDCA